MLFNTLLVIVLSVSGVLSQRGWGVTYTPERICAFKGSSVDMRCTYSYPPYYTVQKIFWVFYDWYSKQEGEDLSKDSEYSHRVWYLGDMNSDCTFRITQLSESDSGTYRFMFLTDHGGIYTGQPGVSLTVTGLQVKVTENEAQSVTLTCSSTCTLSGSPTFTWYKNGTIVSHEYKYSLNLAVTDDTDLYSCATGGVTSPAVNVKCVKVEIESSTVSEGVRVTLTCKITCTDLTGSQTFIWYKNGQSLQNTAQKYQNHNYLQFTASSGDAGSYSCAVSGHENLPSPAVTLYSPKSTSVSVSPSDEIVESSSVTLTCSSSDANPPVQRYTWYKNNRAVSSETGGPEDSYTIKNITLQDAGEYYCEAENGIGTNRSPPKHLDVQCVLSQRGWGVNYTIERICALKGSAVDMSCTYSYPKPYTVQKTFWFIHWNKPQEPEDLFQDPEYSHRVEYLGNNNSDCAFRINQLRKNDSKTYRFRFLTNCDGGKYTGQPGVTLAVTDLQVMVYPDTVREGQSVNLTCSTTCTLTGSPAFIWYSDGSPLSFTDQSHQFRASSEDTGRYSCAVKGYELHSPAVALNVIYAPMNTSVSVSSSGEIVEGSSVTLTCSSDANPPVQNYTWFKKNDTGVWQAGSGQSLNFSNFRYWNRGQYYCEAQNSLGAQNATALQVTVQGGQSLIVAAAVGVAAILALVFLGVVCVRKRKSRNEMEGDGGRQGNKSPIYGNVSGMAMSHTVTQGTDRDDDEVPLYSSVQPANTCNQEQVLYSTVQKPLPQCEEGVQYASIQIPPSSAVPRSPAPSVKEDCVLYSTLRKLDM